MKNLEIGYVSFSNKKLLVRIAVFNLLTGEILSWIEALIRFMPGRIGGATRGGWFGQRFQKSGKVHIGPGCEFISPQNMRFEGLVSIGKNSFFTAELGAISVGDNTSFNMNVHINASVEGKIRIGESCLIGPNVVMRTASHRFDKLGLYIRQQGHVASNIYIDDDVSFPPNFTFQR